MAEDSSLVARQWAVARLRLPDLESRRRTLVDGRQARGNSRAMIRLAAVLGLAFLTSCRCAASAPAASTPSSSVSGPPPGACEAGDRAACARAMAAVLPRKVEPADLPAAHKACDLGDAGGCTVLALAAAQGIGGPKDAEHSFEQARRACELGGALGCRMAGDALEEGAGVSQDASAAALLYDKACEGGDGTGCARFALKIAKGEVASEDPDRAEKLWRKGCEAHVVEACDDLMGAYYDGLLGPEDPKRELELNKLACDGGAALPCLAVFKLYSTAPGDDPLRDWDKSLMPLVALACERGEPQGCELGARMHRDFRVQCDMDRHPGACFLLALTDLHGVGTRRNEAEARELLRELCSRGSEEACERLGTMDGGN